MTVYSRALSDDEIMDIYSAGTTGKCKIFQITTLLLSDAQFKQPFSQTLSAIFGTPPYTWSITSGELPPGVTLDDTGAISGTAEEAGEFHFTVQVTDSSGAVAEKDFVVNVLLTLPQAE